MVRLDGRDIYLGKHDSPASHEKYRRTIAEWLTASGVAPPLQRVKETPGSALSVAELILAFWKYAQGHYRHSDGSSTDELGNIKAALKPLRLLYGRTLAQDFGPLALKAVRDQMVADGLMRTTVNNRVNRIRRAFRWAVGEELVSGAVMESLRAVDGLKRGRTVAKEPEPVRPVPIAIVEATLSHLSRPVAAMVRLQLLTGMRPGEACAMRGCNLKPGDANWTYEPERHKTAWHEKKRVIPIGPKAQSLIREFWTGDPSAYLFRPSDAVAEHHAKRAANRRSKRTPSERAKRIDNPGSKHADRYRRNTYLNAINHACDKAFRHPGIAAIRPGKRTEEQRAELIAWRKSKRWHPNQLRHTVGTEVRARYGLEAAQTVLGHSKADVTQLYAERDLAKAHEVISQIG